LLGAIEIMRAQSHSEEEERIDPPINDIIICNKVIELESDLKF